MIEDPDLKAKLFAQFHQICHPKTVFTTNTSSLLPSMWAEATGRPVQFARGTSSTRSKRPLVDIMPHPGTSPEIVELLVAFAKRIKQLPLVFKKDYPGYVSNAIFEGMNSVAIRIARSDKVTSVEDVDRAVMIHLGMPIGIFGLLDGIGLDTIWHVMESKAPRCQATRAPGKSPTNSSGIISTRAWLGKKFGRGFYTYPDPV